MIGRLNGNFVVARLLRMLPELETVSLFRMEVDQTYPVSGATWTAKREPASEADVFGAGVESTDEALAFVMIDVPGDSLPPRPEDYVEDAVAARWTIKTVETDMFKRIHRVVGVKRRGPTG